MSGAKTYQNLATSTPNASGVPLRYGLVIFPQFEVLDVFGPLEALNSLVRLEKFQHANDLSLVIVAETLSPVSSGPIQGDPKPFNPKIAQSLVPTHTFQDAPEIDVLLVPGGFGTGPKTNSGFRPNVKAVVEYIKSTFPKLQYLITVCTGAGLAAEAGVLDYRAATTNKQAWESITPLGPKTYWVGEARWVVSSDRKVWTTSGVSAGTDGFLAFLAEVYGSDDDGKVFADVASAHMEYSRVKDSTDDPWAQVNGVADVPRTG